MSYQILNRWTGAQIYASETAQAIAEAVAQAIASDADLRGANLSRADLRGADLSDADLSDANLSGADLSGADLRGANLSDANLSRADLRGANLRGANLSGADLSYADAGLANGGEFLVLRGSRHQLIATRNAISIGCMREPLEWWREHYKAVGRAEGYTDEQVSEYARHIEYAAAWAAALPAKQEVAA